MEFTVLRTSALFGLLATVFCASAQGADIRIDFSGQVSTTPGNWNNVTNLTGITANLIDFTSGAGTDLSIDGVGGPWSHFFSDDGGTFANPDWLIQPAPRDGAGLQASQSGTYRVSGLTAPAYRVEVVSARTTFGYLNTITIAGQLANRTSLGTPVVTPWNSTTDGLTP